ncbi:hypothetical protein mRhiFer1_007983 [Rhinolophus ferrumequinum]|uniref:Uncharacterized protein n=1 Tax=Rhinolophus ferrumequinum TaxID=59479 RepID=A0A7J8AV08_RHIFE|nr:hypothetical protein mRhiFer1_007983 [Rhinolophus ferrumequinum]
MTVSSSETEEEGHRHRGDATWRRRQRWEGGGHQPRDAWSPQELEGAGGTVLGPHLCQGEGSCLDNLSTLHVMSPGTLTAVLRKETVKHGRSQREGDLGFSILSLRIGVLWTPRLVYKLGTRYPPTEASRPLLVHCPRIKATFPLCPLSTRVLWGSEACVGRESVTLYYTRPWDPRGGLRVPSTAFCHRPGMHTTNTHSLAAGLPPQGAVSQTISRECPPVFRDLTATAGGFVGQPETHPSKDFKRQAEATCKQAGVGHPACPRRCHICSSQLLQS